MLLYIMLH